LQSYLECLNMDHQNKVLPVNKIQNTFLYPVLRFMLWNFMQISACLIMMPNLQTKQVYLAFILSEIVPL